jgi:ligand-binding sensor domain-containing protein
LTISTEGRATYNPNYVFAIHVAPDDAVWAGTWGGGVSRFDGKRWTNLTAKDGLVGNIVYSIAQGQDGALWFGTNKGVSRFDGKVWQNFTKKEGLLEDNVYALAITPKGEVWAGTRRGVARIAR